MGLLLIVSRKLIYACQLKGAKCPSAIEVIASAAPPSPNSGRGFANTPWSSAICRGRSQACPMRITLRVYLVPSNPLDPSPTLPVNGEGAWLPRVGLLPRWRGRGLRNWLKRLNLIPVGARRCPRPFSNPIQIDT